MSEINFNPCHDKHVVPGPCQGPHAFRGSFHEGSQNGLPMPLAHCRWPEGFLTCGSFEGRILTQGALRLATCVLEPWPSSGRW